MMDDKLPATMAQALIRGFGGKCPGCGDAPLFGRFLKPVAQCPNCHRNWTLRPADDFPPYLVILLIGHLIAPLMIALELELHPAMWIQLLLWPAVVIAMGVGLIQPVKGAVIAFQWWNEREGQLPGATDPAYEPDAPLAR